MGVAVPNHHNEDEPSDELENVPLGRDSGKDACKRFVVRAGVLVPGIDVSNLRKVFDVDAALPIAVKASEGECLAGDGGNLVWKAPDLGDVRENRVGRVNACLLCPDHRAVLGLRDAFESLVGKLDNPMAARAVNVEREAALRLVG